MIHAARRSERRRRIAQIADDELVRVGRGVFRMLDVDAADPVPLLPQVGDEMVSDESAGACDENLCHVPSVTRAAIGMRHPVPNARSVTFNPGAACLRLNSASRTSLSTRRTVSASNPAATISRAG